MEFVLNLVNLVRYISFPINISVLIDHYQKFNISLSSNKRSPVVIAFSTLFSIMIAVFMRLKQTHS